MKPPSQTTTEIINRTKVIDGTLHRQCRICLEWKLLNEKNFYPKFQFFMGHSHECKSCMSKYYKERNTPEKNRKDHLKQRFNLTPEDYKNLYDKQEGKCKICKKHFDLENEDNVNNILHVDHCHKTDKVRGLLCNSCNQGIGHLKDDPTLLYAAIEYLKGGE